MLFSNELVQTIYATNANKYNWYEEFLEKIKFPFDHFRLEIFILKQASKQAIKSIDKHQNISSPFEAFNCLCVHHLDHSLAKHNYSGFQFVWFYLYSGYIVCGPAKAKSSYKNKTKNSAIE